jgi:heme A synthase
MREVTWIRRLALIGAILCFGVVVLGGYTRLSNSGLGCPTGRLLRPCRANRIAEHYATASTCARPGWR